MKHKRFIPLVFILMSTLSSCQLTDWILPYVSLQVDQQLGAASQAGYEQSQSILSPEKYAEAYAYVNHIRGTILASGQLQHAQDFNWDIHIIQDTSVVNAICMPGGHIYLYTGMIQFLDSEDELAGVLGHEMAHADLRHGTSQVIENSGLQLIIGFIFGFDAGGIVQIGQNLLQLKFSRDDEKQADQYAVRYLYHTPYDARGIKHFFEKMQSQSSTHIPEFLSTHPIDEHRSKAIEKTFQYLGGKPGKHFQKEYRHLKELLHLTL